MYPHHRIADIRSIRTDCNYKWVIKTKTICEINAFVVLVAVAVNARTGVLVGTNDFSWAMLAYTVRNWSPLENKQIIANLCWVGNI